MSSLLEDSYGRRFAYLRLSITDVCNFRCVYCLPNGYKKTAGPGFLSLAEIRNLAQGFAEVGTRKIRLTGGEPTLRTDFLEVVRTLKDVSGIDQVALSTNGFSLQELAPQLREAGVTSINVSLDSLDNEKFREFTGSRLLPRILDGIDAALEAGYPIIKVNAVLMKDVSNLDAFMNWARNKPVAIRFIELMRTGGNEKLFRDQHISADTFRRQLYTLGWEAKLRGPLDGPAQEFVHPDYIGRIGLIAPYAKDFCSSCNRLRVSSRGGLRLCLFGDGELSLRDLLQYPDQKEELKNRLRHLLKQKEVSHHLPEGKYGDNQGFSVMGG